MTDKSFTYFLFFLIIYLAYLLYAQNQEWDRLFKIALDQEKAISEQRKSIQTQQLYIQLLENYYRQSSDSPLHPKPL